MAGQRISDMTAATRPVSGDMAPVVRSGVNYKYDLGRRLAESISITDGATVGAGGNDYVAIQSTLTDYPASSAFVPVGSFITRTYLAPPAKTGMHGMGAGSILKTDTASNHVIVVTTADVQIRDLAIQGVNGSDVHNNSAVGFSTGAARTLVQNVDASGMSGSPFFASGGPTNGRISGCYVHGLTGGAANSAAIDLYSTATGFSTDFNILDGTGSTFQVGIINQLTSTQHKHVFNRISNFTGYGGLDYDNTPRSSYNLYLGNDISDISGSILGGTAGAGLYLVSIGGGIIANNHITRTCTATTTESLAPAGIGISEAFSPVLSTANMVHHNSWYGLMVVSSTHIVSSIGDVLVENTKDQLFLKATSNAQMVGTSITALTVGTSVRCVNVNVGGSTDVTGNMLVGIRSRGGGATARAWETYRSGMMTVVGNHHSDSAGNGAYFYGGAGGASGLNLTGNTFDFSAGTGIALTLNNMSNVVGFGVMLKTGGAIALQVLGTCSNAFIDMPAVFASGAWQADPMNFIDNQSPGCIIHTLGTKAPDVAGLSHQKGDTVINRNATVGQPKKWVCSTAGVTGAGCVFTSEGNL